MAVWDAASPARHELDYRLVRDSFVTLFRDEAVLRHTLDWLTERGYQVVTVDASAWTTEDDLHDAVAAALHFPVYYGRNLDALNDCLSDVASGGYGVRPDATGLVLVLGGIEKFTALQRSTVQTVLGIFARQARAAALLGRRMMLLLQTADPRLTFDPVGAQPVPWSDAEWRDADRGL